MELIEWILQDENINKAIKSVKKNKGAYGIDKMSVEELDGYFAKHREEIKSQIREGKYKPTPVRRVYIPKSSGKKRPLGIPTVVDRVVQQATAQVLSLGYDKYFSEHSYGFRPGRSCQTTKSNFLGFTFWKSKDGWKCKPANDRKKGLYDKTRAILCRRKAVARPMKSTFEQLNWLIRGWINYYQIGSMKMFLEEYGQWLRHKVRVVILKQWEKPRRIYLNLQKLNQIIGCGFTHEEIFKVANSRLGRYRRSGMYVVNFAISPEILGRKTKSRPGLVDPLQYYLSNI